MDYKGKRIFLYVNFFKDDNTIGITKKINAQIKALRKMGLLVSYCSYTKKGAEILDNQDRVVYSEKFPTNNEKINRYYRRFLLIKTVTNYFRKTKKNYDYAYLRWHSFDYPYLKMLKVIKEKNSKCVIEAHAFSPNQVAKTLISKYQVYADRLFSKYAKKYVSLVAVMAEYDNVWGIRTIQVDNAVDLDEIEPRNYVKDDNVVRLLCVANEREYHGNDRLLKGISNYYLNGGKTKIHISFVGEYMNSTKRIVEDLNLSDICDFTGKKSGKELDEYYNHSDIGIGALAHHRIGMYSGSSLKTKEYFAKGLPFIYGWKEPAFDDSYPYAKRFELNEEPIDIIKLLDFYNSFKSNSNYITEMREFARIHYSWESEFKKIFNNI